MNFFEYLNNLLFPKNIKCICCGNELECNNDYGVCKNCKSKMITINNPCPTCGDNMLNANNYCLNCKNRKHTYFTQNRSVFIYSGLTKNIVLNAKFNNKKYLSKNIANFLIDSYILNNYKCNLITFVPSGIKRTKERGYNITKLIALEVGNKLNIPVINAMDRIKESHQIDKNFKNRQENILDAFKLKEALDIKNKTILLIDDVYTTGATMNECSRILKNAGASAIYGLTFAHTPKTVNVENNN